MMASFEALSDQLYRRSISHNTREGLRERAKLGYAVGAPPYAYTVMRYIGKERIDRPTAEQLKVSHAEFEKVEEEAPRAHRVFEVAADGLGNGAIAKRLNKQRVPGPDGRPWSKEQVRRVLSNRIYQGVLVHGKYRSVPSGGSTNNREAVPEARVDHHQGPAAPHHQRSTVGPR